MYSFFVGTLHSGQGCSHINKLFSTSNIPPINTKLFKRHEKEIGIAVEDVAKKSCAEAAIWERKLIIENSKEIEKLM